MSAFLFNAVKIDSQLLAQRITTVLLVTITGIEIWWGLEMFECIEKYAVALNLGMSGVLLVALAIRDIKLCTEGT